ncbi:MULTISPECIES: RimK/LysX family protein [unclassified Vibrio]|uniref:ATP-dependent zinc protease n=1 Tax=Vibrio sp. HB236076 TaxID=3232307 RepID=A0AB39HJW7_9VIBR|nr:RimK/LysX family protein [Vibrio sp. HB161653]MDP5253277.1 RimK/LysX family protein [Vibrio sp. HB161653]
MDKLIIGRTESINLPDLGIFGLLSRVDTGAKTSSIHVDNTFCTVENGQRWVEFDLHPDVYHLDEIVHCRAKLKSTRKIKSSNGSFEYRCVITTTLEMGGQRWPIDISLSNRQDMTYLMLLGRQAMKGRVLVDPSAKHLLKKR